MDPFGSSPMDFIHIQKFFLKLMDLLGEENRSPTVKRVHKTALFIWRAFCLYLGCLLQNLALFTPQSPEAMLRVPFVALTVSKLVIKGTVFLVNKREISEMWLKLSDNEFRAKNSREMKYITEAQFYIRVINYYGFVYFLNVIVFTIIPMLSNALPFIFWYPFDPYQSVLMYNVIYLYEVLCALACSATNLSVNTYMFVVFICMNFYYSLLGERAQPIGHRSVGGSNVTKSKEAFYREMIDLINFHLKINDFVSNTLILFNNFLFIQILQAALCFALSSMVLLLVDLHGGDALVPILFLITNGIEMYIYCYFANNITHTYDTLSTSVYFGNFVEFDKKTSKAMLLLMQITGARELKIQTVGFVRFELSLEMFMKIVKTTYSLITVIRSV